MNQVKVLDGNVTLGLSRATLCKMLILPLKCQLMRYPFYPLFFFLSILLDFSLNGDCCRLKLLRDLCCALIA